MPSGSYAQVHVKCPYYSSDNGKNRIICEGLIPGSMLSSFYAYQKDFQMQMEIFCTSDGYYRCEICAALDKKHEDDD